MPRDTPKYPTLRGKIHYIPLLAPSLYRTRVTGGNGNSKPLRSANLSCLKKQYL